MTSYSSVTNAARGSAWSLPRSLSRLRPQACGLLAALNKRIWHDADPVLLELARLRTAQLIGNPVAFQTRYADVEAGTEAKIAALRDYPCSPLFSAAEREALAFTEQFVIDPHGVEDAQRDAVIDHCTLAGLVALCEALAVFDGLARLRNVLEVDAPPSTTVVPAPTGATPLW